MIDRRNVQRREGRSLAVSLVAVLATLVLASSTLAAGWSAPIELGTFGNYALETSRSVAASGGVIHAIMWQDQSVAYQRSTDAGVTWQPDVKLATTSSTTSYHALGIAVSHSLVVALFKGKGPGTRRSLLFRRSTDGGQTWKSTLTIARYSSSSKEMGDGDVVVAGSKVLVTWTDRTTSKILARRSTDGGATFKSVQTIGSTRNGTGALRDGDVAAAAAGSKVYIVWKPRNNKGIVLRRSTDGGANWKTQQSITGGAVSFQTPAVSASGSKLLVLYTLPSRALRLARSMNSGGSFASSTVRPGADYPGHDDVLISGSQARLTFNESSQVKIRTSADGGATWTPAQTLAYGAFSNVVISGGHTVVAWEVPDEFTATTFSSRSN